LQDPTSAFPFWETIIASVIASGLLSSLITILYERRKQSKDRQLLEIKKALSFLREDYEEVRKASHEFEKGKQVWGNDVPLPFKNSKDVWISLYLCCPRLDKTIEEYLSAIGLVGPVLSERGRKVLKRVTDDSLKCFATTYDIILKDLIFRWQKIMGIRKSFFEKVK
jgi:hypothetical protein